nr:MAG TPA: hypothetical protein [Caudoviricetes sp.]
MLVNISHIEITKTGRLLTSWTTHIKFSLVECMKDTII